MKDPGREEALAHEARERSKLDGMVKVLRDRMKHSAETASGELERTRLALESVRAQEKEATRECERLRKELAALRAARSDESGGATLPDHVTFGAYVQKRREGKHREAKSMVKRAAQMSKQFGVLDTNANANNKFCVAGGGGMSKLSTTPTLAPVPVPSSRKTVTGDGTATWRALESKTGVAPAAAETGAGLGGSRGSGIGVGVDVVGGGRATIRHGRRRGAV